MKKVFIFSLILGAGLCLTQSAEAYKYHKGHHYKKVTYHSPHKEHKIYRYGFHILHDIVHAKYGHHHHHHKYKKAKHYRYHKKPYSKVCRVYYDDYGRHSGYVKKCVYR